MMTTANDTDTRGGTTAAPFDPARYLSTVNGKPYLEVVYRGMWIRSEHPDAIMRSKIEHLDMQAGVVVFHAHVEIPGGGSAEGTGMETRDNFPEGWLEKAETIAYGRALALLGYGTAFALADFEEGRLADSPVALANGTHIPAAPSGNGHTRPAPIRPSSNLATTAQLRLIYLTGSRDLALTEEEIEETCQRQYGRLPLHLTKKEASRFIDGLKAATTAKAKAV